MPGTEGRVRALASRGQALDPSARRSGPRTTAPRPANRARRASRRDPDPASTLPPDPLPSGPGSPGCDPRPAARGPSTGVCGPRPAALPLKPLQPADRVPGPRAPGPDRPHRAAPAGLRTAHVVSIRPPREQRARPGPGPLRGGHRYPAPAPTSEPTAAGATVGVPGWPAGRASAPGVRAAPDRGSSATARISVEVAVSPSPASRTAGSTKSASTASAAGTASGRSGAGPGAGSAPSGGAGAAAAGEPTALGTPATSRFGALGRFRGRGTGGYADPDRC